MQPTDPLGGFGIILQCRAVFPTLGTFPPGAFQGCSLRLLTDSTEETNCQSGTSKTNLEGATTWGKLDYVKTKEIYELNAIVRHLPTLEAIVHLILTMVLWRI